MANTSQDEIYQSFLSVSQQQMDELAQEKQSLADLILQADQVRQDVAQQYVRTTAGASGSSGSSGSGSGGGSALSTVLDVFKSGLGLSPLVEGIMSLFSGGGSSAPPTLTKYALPAAINFQAGEANGQITNLDYDQNGMPRFYGAPQSVDGAAEATGVASAAPLAQQPATPAVAGNGPSQGAATPQITVNVQAMDARSFMDRSSEIALAVREAMLNLNAINDVVSDL
ncbi:MAG TPA: hypothetical protein VMH28_18500 [Candidatus Acidoferrales bacterium]|nr:hypothetical protein [Candidatus Acidoferrales bacterium]